MTDEPWRLENPPTDIERAVALYRLYGDYWALENVLLTGKPVMLTPEDARLVFDWITGKIKLPPGGAPHKHYLSRAWIQDLPMRAAVVEVARLKAEAKSNGKKLRHADALEAAAKRYDVNENTLAYRIRRSKAPKKKAHPVRE